VAHLSLSADKVALAASTFGEVIGAFANRIITCLLVRGFLRSGNEYEPIRLLRPLFIESASSS